MATITSEAWTNQSPKNVNTYPHTYLLSSKTMRGSLFPLLPLRVKCQNHERVPISPISPILVVHALSSCQDMGHQNRGNRDPFMVLALHQGKTLRGSLFPLFPLRVKCQNHERVPISPISPGGANVYSLAPILVVQCLWSSCQDMGHQNKGNRGNRDPLMVLALHQGKALRGPLFPLFPRRVKCQNHERVPISPISPILVVHVLARWKDRPLKIGEIGEIGTLSWTLRGNHGFGTSPLGEIGEIETLSWFWHFTLRGNRGSWEGPYFPYFGGPCLDRMNRHWPPI